MHRKVELQKEVNTEGLSQKDVRLVDNFLDVRRERTRLAMQIATTRDAISRGNKESGMGETPEGHEDPIVADEIQQEDPKTFVKEALEVAEKEGEVEDDAPLKEEDLQVAVQRLKNELIPMNERLEQLSADELSIVGKMSVKARRRIHKILNGKDTLSEEGR